MRGPKPRDVTSTFGQTRRGRSAARGRTSPDRKTSPAAPRRDSPGCVFDVKGNIQLDRVTVFRDSSFLAAGPAGERSRSAKDGARRWRLGDKLTALRSG